MGLKEYRTVIKWFEFNFRSYQSITWITKISLLLNGPFMAQNSQCDVPNIPRATNWFPYKNQQEQLKHSRKCRSWNSKD